MVPSDANLPSRDFPREIKFFSVRAAGSEGVCGRSIRHSDQHATVVVEGQLLEDQRVYRLRTGGTREWHVHAAIALRNTGDPGVPAVLALCDAAA
jgi:hypothetical protein